MRRVVPEVREIGVPATPDQVVGALVGARVWHVSAGGSGWPVVQVAVGERVARARPLSNDRQPSAFRDHESELGVMAWRGRWVLSRGGSVLASSDGPDPYPDRSALDVLVGEQIKAVTLRDGGLLLDSTGDLRFEVTQSTDGDGWWVWTPTTTVVSAAGGSLGVEAS